MQRDNGLNRQPAACTAAERLTLRARQAAPGQPWAYAGYKLTVYSNLEEKLNDLMWWDTVPKARPDRAAHTGHAVPCMPSGACCAVHGQPGWAAGRLPQPWPLGVLKLHHKRLEHAKAVHYPGWACLAWLHAQACPAASLPDMHTVAC